MEWAWAVVGWQPLNETHLDLLRIDSAIVIAVRPCTLLYIVCTEYEGLPRTSYFVVPGEKNGRASVGTPNGNLI